MRKLFNELTRLCPGRLHILIDQHKVYNETASQVIERESEQFATTTLATQEMMCLKNSIIQVDAAAIDKPMPPVTVFSYDIEQALKETLKQIKAWKPEK